MVNPTSKGLKTVAKKGMAKKGSRKYLLSLCSGLCSGLSLTIGTIPSQAALPDRAVQTLVSQIYSHHWATDRTGCDYYIHPNNLNQRGGQQRLIVLRTQGKLGGSACNGVFEFEVLTANCEQRELSISNEIGSPASWVVRRYRNPEAVREVCSGLGRLSIPSQQRLLEPLPSIKPPQTPAASIPVMTRQEAIDFVETWLAAKSIIFARPYDQARLAQLATGELYQDISSPGKGIDWLRKEDAQWRFGIQRIGCVEKFAAYRDGRATIDLWVTEDRRLVVKGKTDRSQTTYATQLFRYEFMYVGDRWKIANYDDVKGVKRPRSTCS